MIHKCTSVRHSLKAESIGCDAVSVDGFECGGHPGEDDIPNFILLPRAAEELTIPFVASGGMADGRSLVAALALGADGINMGTRFIATKEAPVHDHVKQALVAASELDTRLVMRPLRNTERVLKNAAVDRLLEKERTLGAALTFADIADEVAGVYPRIMQQGEMDAGVWSCGMVAGLIHDVPTVRELIDRIMAEAERHHPHTPERRAGRVDSVAPMCAVDPEEDAMTDHVLRDISNGVLTLTLNRPEKKNALTRAMYQALADGIDGAGTDPDIRCVLIQAEGDMFTAGNDLSDFAAANRAEPPADGSPASQQSAARRAGARDHADRGGGERPRGRRRDDHAAALRSRLRVRRCAADHAVREPRARAGGGVEPDPAGADRPCAGVFDVRARRGGGCQEGGRLGHRERGVSARRTARPGPGRRRGDRRPSGLRGQRSPRR